MEHKLPKRSGLDSVNNIPNSTIEGNTKDKGNKYA